jgi:hypothetical protein
MKTPMEFLRDRQEKGAIGYILLWLLGVPASILVLVFLFARLHVTNTSLL